VSIYFFPLQLALFYGMVLLTLTRIRHVKTLVGEIDFSFHALNPSGTNPGGLSMKANDKTE
jgi:hypothetical protein